MDPERFMVLFLLRHTKNAPVTRFLVWQEIASCKAKTLCQVRNTMTTYFIKGK